MSKSAAVLGLAAIASASISAAPAYGGSSSAPAYGGSSAPVYGGSSSAPVYGGSSSYPDGPASSSYPAGYPSASVSWSGYPSGSASAPAYPSGSYSSYPSASYSSYPSVSVSAVPSHTPFPTCWTECFQEAGISSESDVCGNTEVDKCIHDTCDCEDSWSYWSWYESYCPAPSSSAAPYPSSSVSYYPSSVSAVPSSTPTIECWGQCFAENDITSESELCGNTAVNECIATTCDCEDDKAYWAWYESYCPAPSSSSASPTTPVVPATPTPTDCWSQCFEEAGIASESELCGNTAVDQCIHDTCSAAEDQAYWAWYNSYCEVTTVTTPVVTPTASATPSSTPVDSCWTDCFAQYDVTSESALCGNDDVSKCIHDTCDAALDKAYWDWYNGFCVPTSTSCQTITTVITPSATPYSPVTTTYVSTATIGWAPGPSAPASGLPAPPAYPVGPYSSYAPAAPSGGAASPTGYPTASASWAPAPATGGSAANKPGFVLAAVLAAAAFF